MPSRTRCPGTHVRSSIALVAIVVGAVVPLSACVMLETYGDGAIPTAERAVVKGYWHYRFIYDEELHIASVDGDRGGGNRGWPYAYAASLPAGHHWLQLAILRNGGAIAGCAFEWRFEAGHHYKIRRVRHDQFLLAHPSAERFAATVEMVVIAPDTSVQDLHAPAVCGKRPMCRLDADCTPALACRTGSGFEFGVCVPRDP